MKYRIALGAAMAALVLVLGVRLGFGEDEAPAPAPMSEQEMWAKTAQLAQPSEMHETVLAKLVGEWKTEGKAITGMGEFPFTGSSVHTSVMGGRFVQVAYEGPFMGGAFEGAGFIGYDNLSQTFQQVWIMTMATNVDVMTGTWDAETQTLTWRGETAMCDGNTYKKRSTARFEGEDKMISESFATGPDGQERKEMEMVYTRVK